MRDTAESVSEVEPGEVDVLLVPFAVGDDCLEGKGVLMTTFVRAGTLLVGGKEVQVNGTLGDPRGDEGHKQFVEAGEEGDGSVVCRVFQRAFFRDEDGGRFFPLVWYLLCKEASIEYDSEDGGMRVDEAEVTVFDFVLPGGRVLHGGQSLANFMIGKRR